MFRAQGGVSRFARRKFAACQKIAVHLALALLLALAAPVAADDDADAIAAYKSGDYEATVRLWKPLAEQGNASAQNNLAAMYENGRGVPQDDAEAVKWYRKAADQGYTVAQNNLAFMYANGLGVPQNNVLALMWYCLAAANETESVRYGQFALNRDRLRAEMPRTEIAEAERLAAAWQPKPEISAN